MKTNTETETSGNAGTTTTKSRIFLVDDHPITRQGVAVLINQERDLTVCGEADSAPMAIDMIQKLAPDVALVGSPELHAAGTASGKRSRSVMGTDSS